MHNCTSIAGPPCSVMMFLRIFGRITMFVDTTLNFDLDWKALFVLSICVSTSMFGAPSLVIRIFGAWSLRVTIVLKLHSFTNVARTRCCCRDLVLPFAPLFWCFLSAAISMRFSHCFVGVQLLLWRYSAGLLLVLWHCFAAPLLLLCCRPVFLSCPPRGMHKHIKWQSNWQPKSIQNQYKVN